MSFPYPCEDCFSKVQILVIARELCRGGWYGIHEVYGGKVGFNLFFSLAGWDQSDKFIKIYISLNGVQKLPAENVQVNFTER